MTPRTTRRVKALLKNMADRGGDDLVLTGRWNYQTRTMINWALAMGFITVKSHGMHRHYTYSLTVKGIAEIAQPVETPDWRPNTTIPEDYY